MQNPPLVMLPLLAFQCVQSIQVAPTFVVPTFTSVANGMTATLMSPVDLAALCSVSSRLFGLHPVPKTPS